jgi:hypothetical protein
MAYTLRFHPDKKIVLLRHTGQLTMEDALQARAAAVPWLNEIGLWRLLADIREAELSLSLAELFSFNASHAEAFPKGTRIACVFSPDKARLEDVQFSETVAQNRGAMLRVFVQEPEALDWLTAPE